MFFSIRHTPDCVICALHHASISISSSSISRAIKSMSARTVELLTTLGAILFLFYAYDNPDIQMKPLTPTLEKNVDPLRHLTSALDEPAKRRVGRPRHDLDCLQRFAP